MTADSNGARIATPGKGLNRDTSAVTEDPRGASGSNTGIVASADHVREQLTLPIFPPADPLPPETYRAADVALDADKWQAAGYAEAIRHLAGSGQEFSADTARGIVGDPATQYLLGAVFAHAARQGIIRAVHVQASARRERRGGLRRVWVGSPEFIASIRTSTRGAVG